MRDTLRQFIARFNKVQNKIFLPFIAVMLVIAAVIIYAMTDLVSSNIEARVNEKLQKDVRLIQEIITDTERSLAFYAQFMADTEKLAGHIAEARDSRLVLIHLLEFLKENEISSSIGGTTLDESSRLDRLGMLGIRTTGLWASEQDGKTTLNLSAVAPIEGRAGSRSVITVSRQMDERFLWGLRRKTGTHSIRLYYEGKLVDASSADDDCSEIIDKALTPMLMRDVLGSGNPYMTEFSCNNHVVRMMLAPLSINFKRDALVAVFESMDDLARTRTNIIVTTVMAVGLMLLITVPLYVMTVSHTVAPIRELSRASRAIAEGKLDQHVNVKTGDEVGELSASFNKMIDDLRQYREDIERWNQTLEERVAKRTQELAEAQAKLVQSEKLAAVGELAAGIAHELNNPLAGIYAFLQVFAETIHSRGLKELSDEEARSFQENLVYVEREIQRCKSIIGSLLTFARVSDKQFTLVDMNRALADTLALTQSNLAKSGIKVKINLEERIPLVNGDPNELQQVFLNIIVNARKAMPDGGSLTVTTSTDDAKGSVRVSFADTGMGIQKGLQEKIFDPFFTTSKPGEGTGLGLSISYGIVKDHNGEILVESAPGKGATFTVVLPAANTVAIASESTSSSPESGNERHA